MNKIIKYTKAIYFMAGLALMTACNSDDYGEVGYGDDWDSEGYPVYGVQQDALYLNVYLDGEKINDSGYPVHNWQDGETIGVYVTSGELGSPYLGDAATYNNIKSTYNEGYWRMDTKKVTLTTDSAVVYAYSPYQQELDPTAWLIDSRTGDVFMYGTHAAPQTAVVYGDMIAKVILNQTQSLLDIRIRKEPDCMEELILDGIYLKKINPSGTNDTDPANGLPVTGTVNIQTGELTYASYGEYKREHLRYTLTNEYTNDNRVLIPVLPYDIQGNDVEIVFVVNGVEMSLSLDQRKDWNVGMRNVYSVSLTGSSASMDVLIKPWEDINNDLVIQDKPRD